MKAIFLTVVNISTIKDIGLYPDLINELKQYYEDIVVVCPLERRHVEKTHVIKEDNVSILRVKLPTNINQTNAIERGISMLIISRLFKRAIYKYFPNDRFQLILYPTPPVTIGPLVRDLKQQFNAITALLLKDIFPQNAVDLNMLKENSFMYQYFKKQETLLYKVSDYIGVMSEANEKFITNHHPNIVKNKIHIFRNGLYDISQKFSHKKAKIFRQYGLDAKKVTFIYGGNIGVPQSPEKIKAVAQGFNKIPNAQMVIVGNGTEFEDVVQATKHIDNVITIQRLSQRAYHQLLKESNVGFIFLDERFTIPNYPQRLTSYFMFGKPVIAMTDSNTDAGSEIVKQQCGYWVNNGDYRQCLTYVSQLTDNQTLRAEMGTNARRFYESEFKIEQNVEAMMKQIKQLKK